MWKEILAIMPRDSFGIEASPIEYEKLLMNGRAWAKK